MLVVAAGAEQPGHGVLDPGGVGRYARGRSEVRDHGVLARTSASTKAPETSARAARERVRSVPSDKPRSQPKYEAVIRSPGRGKGNNSSQADTG